MTPHGLKATRDVSKLLLTKQYYNRSNAHILKDPMLHRTAILEGFKSEEVSHLIEDMLLATIRHRPPVTSFMKSWW